MESAVHNEPTDVLNKIQYYERHLSIITVLITKALQNYFTHTKLVYWIHDWHIFGCKKHVTSRDKRLTEISSTGRQ